MRRLISLCVALLALVVCSFAQKTMPAEIRIGDVLSVYVFNGKDLSGDYVVQSDGAIYLPRVGRIIVDGLNADSAQRILLDKLKAIFSQPTATLSIRTQKPYSIYVVGGSQSVLDYTPGTDLRQVFAAAKVDGEPDLLQLSVFRQGQKIASMSVSDLTSGKVGLWNGPLQQNDLVVIEPKPFIRVWVVGTVARPGRVRLNVGDDVYRAIADAGDVTGGGAIRRTEMVITVRRGPEVIRLPLVPDPAATPFKLEEGDTVSVQPPSRVRITFSGEVSRPGELLLPEGVPLTSALANVGGPTNLASLRNVMLYRNGNATFYNLTASMEGEGVVAGPVVQEGDIVVVPRNERVFFVLGNANRPGRYSMLDSRIYRLSDAIADANGLAPNGTNRRMAVGKSGPDGKLVVKQYNLDEYLKDGKQAANPMIEPGDVIFVDSPRGLTFQQVVSAMSAGLVLQSFAR